MKMTCESCNGTGQVSYFKGESRFLLSTDECFECSGLGFIMTDDDDQGAASRQAEQPPKKKRSG